jgi:hypothetical protein
VTQSIEKLDQIPLFSFLQTTFYDKIEMSPDSNHERAIDVPEASQSTESVLVEETVQKSNEEDVVKPTVL